jgi:threonine dehydrogenase-like Zn-dependent dehydrogenase
MRATLMYQAGDVRVEDVPDAHLIEATDALVRVSHAAVCGSDLWPYKSLEPTESGVAAQPIRHPRAPRVGLEPTTLRLTAGCSAN